MNFPLLLSIVLTGILVVVGVPVVYLLSKALRLHPKPIEISQPRKEVARVSVVVVVLFAFIFAWRTLVYVFAYGVGIAVELPNPTVDSSTLLWLSGAQGISLLILAVAVKITGQTFGSVGINRNNLPRVVALGLISSAIYLAVTGSISVLGGGGFAGFSPSLAYGLIWSAASGFAEETVWRGYVQTRLVAYAGTTKGILITSLLFGVLWHFPRAYYFEASKMVLSALAWTLPRVFGGVIFGYIMVRSQNIVASSIFHSVADWTVALWR